MLLILIVVGCWIVELNVGMIVLSCVIYDGVEVIVVGV